MNFLSSSLEPEGKEKIILIVYPEKLVTQISYRRPKIKVSVYPEEEFKHALSPSKANALTIKLPSIANWEKYFVFSVLFFMSRS